MNPNPPPDPPPGDELPPQLASPEAFLRWCRENPDELRRMGQTVRRVELGEFGDLTPELRKAAAGFSKFRAQMHEAGVLSAKMLGDVAAIREALTTTPGTIPVTHLVQQLEEIERRIKQGEATQEEWVQFKLQFAAFQGELIGSLWFRGAKIAIHADAHERRDPQRFAHDDNAQKLLRFWRAEGGREQWLGSVTLAERRELEEMERKCREDMP